MSTQRTSGDLRFSPLSLSLSSAFSEHLSGSFCFVFFRSCLHEDWSRERRASEEGGGVSQPTYFCFFFWWQEIKKLCVIWVCKASTGTVTKWPWGGSFKKPNCIAGGTNETSKHDKIYWGRWGWEGKKEEGINELSQIKPCSYCTLETCCHGSRKGERGRERFKRSLEVKGRESGELSHSLKHVTTATHKFTTERRFIYKKDFTATGNISPTSLSQTTLI